MAADSRVNGRNALIASAGAPMAFRYLSVAATVGIVGMLILIGLAQWNEILGFVIVVAVSLGGYALLRQRPAVR